MPADTTQDGSAMSSDNENRGESERDLLVRIDERTNHIMAAMPDLVTQKEFIPVRRLVYGGTAVVLVTICSTVLANWSISGPQLESQEPPQPLRFSIEAPQPEAVEPPSILRNRN